MRYLWLLSVIVSLFLFPYPGRTDEAGAQANLALEAFEKGTKLFSDGKFLEAAHAFREANRLKPAWKLHFNIGQSEAAAKRYGRALEAFESYLAEGGDDVPRDRQLAVIDEIERLKSLVGTLLIHGEPGDKVVIDDVVIGTLPQLERMKISVGVRRIQIVRNEAIVAQTDWRVSSGEFMDVYTLNHAPEEKNTDESESSANVPKVAANESNEDLPRGKRIAGWLFTAIGGAAIAGGAVTGGFAVRKNRDLEKECPGNNCFSDSYDALNARDTLATSSTILFAAGGAVVFTGIVLLIAGKHSETSSATLTPTFGGLTLWGRF